MSIYKVLFTLCLNNAKLVGLEWVNGYGVCFTLTWLRQVSPPPRFTKPLLPLVLGLELDPMYATDRRQSDVGQKHHLMPPPYGSGGICETVHRFKIKMKS